MGFSEAGHLSFGSLRRSSPRPRGRHEGPEFGQKTIGLQAFSPPPPPSYRPLISWVPEGSLVRIRWRHEMALELVCRADFWCNRHCTTSPVVLEGCGAKFGRKSAENRPKKFRPDCLQVPTEGAAPKGAEKEKPRLVDLLGSKLPPVFGKHFRGDGRVAPSPPHPS